MDIVEFAHQIIAMDERIRSLEIENADLRQYRAKYTQSLRDGIEHGEVMMGGLLSLALKPGVMEAISRKS